MSNFHQKLLLAVTVALAAVVGVGSAPADDALVADLFTDRLEMVFEHLTIDDGLPENSVRAMLQDRNGFVWLGTQNGLVRYDGRTMVVHTPVPGDSNSFGGRTVDALWESDDGDIWVGTFLAGLWRYDHSHGGFRRVHLVREEGEEPLHVFDIRGDATGLLWIATEEGLASVDPRSSVVAWYPEILPVADDGEVLAVNAVQPDDRGRVWCATDGRGIARLDPASDTVQWFRHQQGMDRSLPADVVYDLLLDPQGRLWAATVSGLGLWQEIEEGFRTFLPEPGATADSGLNVFISLVGDPRGMIWAGSAGGLYAFDPGSGRFRLFAHDPERKRSPVNGPILSVMVDRSGVVWGGSWHTGLNKADPTTSRFRVRRFSMPEVRLPSAPVDAVAEDRQGRLWVAVGEKPRGTGRGRLFVREAHGEEFRPVATRSERGTGLAAGRSICEADDGTIFVGSYRGLWQYAEGAIVPAAEVNPGLPEALTSSAVNDIVADHDGNLWFATWSGLVKSELRSGRTQVYRHDGENEHSLSWNDPVTLHVDAAGRVWIGSDSRGLNLYRPDRDDFLRFFSPDRGLETVSAIHEDGEGVLWLASYAGLVRFDPATGDTRVFGRNEGLPNDQVSSVLGDADGLLWLSTGYGIASFDPRTFDIRSYDTRDGLPDNEVRFAAARGRDGRLYFGGAGGLVIFEPGKFRHSDFVPPVVVTDVAVDGASLAVGPQEPLALLPHLTDRVTLPHQNNDIAFSFAALDFSRPDQNRFLYMLEGADDGWRDAGDDHRVSYANLPPGTYTFRVRGTNRDGVWNDQESALALRILPPWWLTGWAWAAYILVLGLAVWAILRQLTNRERMRTSLELQRAEAAKLHELDEFKTRFLTNITHEFRTPLTLIKVPLQRLSQEQGPDPDPRLETMLRNTNRLEQLIDQLLDLSRLEAGRLPVRWQRGDCMSLLRVYVAGFENVVAQRGIELVIRASTQSCVAWHDGDLLEKLVGNLLTNAVKHTPDEGRILVAMACGPARPVPPPGTGPAAERTPVPAQEMVIAVTNTGSFIAEEDRERVFDRFYQTSAARGSGVGLSLVKELTQWLGGRVDVVSDSVHGTCFTVAVPVFLAHPEGEAAEAEAAMASTRSDPDKEIDEEDFEEDDEEETGSGLKRVLVVEDNTDMRSFMAQDLRPEFEVYEAGNGDQGLSVALAEIPDLVLSDVMMPGMDGFELCRRLKEDERTCHVPVILLTARAEAESRHAGLRLGADDYVAKPFDAEDLRLRIRNLIEQRRKLAATYERRLAVLSPESMPVTSADERFIVQLRQAIDTNLDDPEFKINELCREVGMSRSQLHRKLTAVTGKTTSDFVRTHRLQRAAQLFDGGYGNVTEVAYAVGFRNLSYFARCFRDLYGQHPSEYLRSQPEEN